MANEQNLKPGEHKLTKEEQSQGGKKSGEVRRLQSAVRKLLSSHILKGFEDIEEGLKDINIEDKDNNAALAYAMMQKALQGDKQCADWVRDTGGEKPKDEVNIEGNGVVILSGDDKIAD